jgi:hypothetical protein
MEENAADGMAHVVFPGRCAVWAGKKIRNLQKTETV